MSPHAGVDGLLAGHGRGIVNVRHVLVGDVVHRMGIMPSWLSP